MKGKYCYQDHNRYVVKKWVNEQNVFYGSYSTKEAAQKIVEALEKADWNKDLLPEIRNNTRNEGFIL